MLLKMLPPIPAQIPPTPTPLPPPSDIPITMPDTSLWRFAPEAVQGWNMLPDTWTIVIQAILILGLIILAVVVIKVYMHRLTDETELSE